MNQFFLLKENFALIPSILDINSSLTISPTKMSAISSPDDSPKDDGKEDLLLH